MPAISVCIPTYNRRARIQRVIEIVLQSRCDDFELIVSDNASSDGTDAMLASIKDPRFRWVRQPETVEICRHHDTVIGLAAAPLVFRMDDDDYIGDRYLMKMLDLFRGHPEIVCAFAGFAHTSGYEFRRDSEVVDRGVFAGREVIEGHELVRAFLMHDPFPGFHTASVVFKKDAWKEVGGFQTIRDDQRYVLSLASLGRVGYIPEVHFYYVHHYGGRESMKRGRARYEHIQKFDLLDLYKAVYNSPFRQLRELPEIQGIREEVRRRHLRVYPGIHFYCARNNYNSRWAVAYCGWCMAQKYPRVLADPLAWGAFLAMLTLPMPLLRRLMQWYRTRRG